MKTHEWTAADVDRRSFFSFFFFFPPLCHRASLETFSPFILFPAFGLALQGPFPTIARPDGHALHRGLHKTHVQKGAYDPQAC